MKNIFFKSVMIFERRQRFRWMRLSQVNFVLVTLSEIRFDCLGLTWVRFRSLDGSFEVELF